MSSPWKAISDDSRRQILSLLRKKDMTPTEIGKHFDFSLPALSAHLRILKDAGLILEEKIGKNRFYSLNKNQTKEMAKFFEGVWNYKLSSLKEFVENKERRKTNGRTRN